MTPIFLVYPTKPYWQSRDFFCRFTMEPKKKMMSSLMEDLSGPSMTPVRSSSPFRTGGLTSSAHARTSHRNVDPNTSLSCVYVDPLSSPRTLSPPPSPPSDLTVHIGPVRRPSKTVPAIGSSFGPRSSATHQHACRQRRGWNARCFTAPNDFQIMKPCSGTSPGATFWPRENIGATITCGPSALMISSASDVLVIHPRERRCSP